MEKYSKYSPFVLIVVTVIIGLFLLLNKGVISLPETGNKTNIVKVNKSSVVDILFSGDEYKFSYSSFDPSKFVNIAKFDKTEQWQGTGSIDDDLVIGSSVISLSDRDRGKATAFLVKNFNLSSIDIIKFSINLKDDPDNVESINLIFSNKNGTSYYRFPLSNFVEGINRFSIPKYRFLLAEEGVESNKQGTPASSKTSFGWDKIEKVQVELVARPAGKANISVGWIRGEKEGIFDPDWNWDKNDHFLNLTTGPDGKITLLVQNVGKGIGILKKITNVKDFTYSTKIIPLNKGSLGLFFRGDYKTGYGYYLAIGGVGTSDWSISKYYVSENQPKTLVILNGQIANFEFTENEPIWLKVVAKGNNITGYFSLDGKAYTKLGEIADNAFGTGGIGVATANGSRAYIDDFYLSLK